jgi:transcriptional regulator
VPTWNYAVAHLHGTLETFDDEASLAAVVDGLTGQHEASVGGDWRFEFGRANLPQPAARHRRFPLHRTRASI